MDRKNNMSHRILKTLGIIAILIILTGVAQAGDWPMFHHDVRHTGYTTESIPDDLELLWSYETGSAVTSSPAVANGKVFVGSMDNKIYCLDENTGNLIWSYETGGHVQSSPAVVDGKVFVGSDDNKVYCLNEDDGRLIWSYETGSCARPSPAVANGKVFVGSGDHKVYCLDANDGNLIWSYENGSWVGGFSSSPAVTDGKVFAGSYKKLYCLDENTGKLIWSYEVLGWIDKPPAVANGKVFVGSEIDDKIYCMDEDTGELIWSYETGSHVQSSPAVANGKVFVGSYDNNIYCLDEDDGSLIWSYETGDYVYASPAVADGKVFVGSGDDNIYCLDEDDGSLVWSYKIGGWVDYSSPAIANGKVFVGSGDNKIYCFGAKSTPTPVPVTPTPTPVTPTPVPTVPPTVAPTPTPEPGPTPTPYVISTPTPAPTATPIPIPAATPTPEYSQTIGDVIIAANNAGEAITKASLAIAYAEEAGLNVAGAKESLELAIEYLNNCQQLYNEGRSEEALEEANKALNSAKDAEAKAESATPEPEISIPPLYILGAAAVIVIILIASIGLSRKRKRGKSTKRAEEGLTLMQFLHKTEEEWFDLGSKEKNPSKKLLYYTKCLELNPKNADAWDNKGNALGMLGRYEEALRCYDRALEINPKGKYGRIAWTLKGFTLNNLKRYEEAIRCFDKALEIDPNFEYAKNNKKIAEEKIKEDVSAKVKEHRFTIERAIYDPCKRDFIEGQLPRMKEWINRYDPGAYWFAMSIQNNTDRAIEEWGVELETSSALKIKEARVEGIDYKIELHETHPEPYKNKYAIGVPKEYGIVIPKGGAQRVYFKLRADKPKTVYEISGVFKSAITGEVPIRAKEFKYLCDTGVSPEAVKAELKKTFSEKDAARLALSFKTVQELERMCDQEAKTEEYLDKLSSLKGYTEGFSENFTNQLDEFSRFMKQEQLEYLDDEYKVKVRRFCTNLVDVWISEFLKG